jgi:hypothetical protein
VSADFAAFLADSLVLWNVEGRVEAGASPAVTVIRAGDCTVTIERPVDADAAWRWFVRWQNADMVDERSRPCASLVGLLNALRSALGVERGNAVRIAPAPIDSLPCVSGGGPGRGQA